MANKITTIVYSEFGESYQTDVFITHPSKRCNIQDLDTGSIVVGLDFFVSQSAQESGSKPFKAINNQQDKLPINDVVHVNNITSREEVFTCAQNAVTAHLKAIYGNDNVIEI